ANTRPQGINGGNMAVTRLTVGARLYLPVHQRGALFYTGDSHAVQGDGEINGTAIEASLAPVLQFVVHKRAGAAMKWPRAEDADNYYVMGMDVDLDAALKEAALETIAFLQREKGLSPADAYSVAIFDVGTDPLAPKTLVVLPLANTIVGPPVNLAITPDESLALVANSMNVVQEGGAWKQVPDNRIWIIDLTVNPPKLIDTIAAGKQPSGMSINRAGNLALVANRADGSISVLRISGKKVELIDTVTIGEQVAHVVFTPDG